MNSSVAVNNLPQDFLLLLLNSLTNMFVIQTEEERLTRSRQPIVSVSRIDSGQVAIRFVTTPKTFVAWQRLRRERSLDDSQLAAFLLQW